MKLFWISCYLGLFHLKIERGMNVNFCIWGSRKCHFLYIWGSWKWNFDLYGGLENAIFVYGVSAMPFCCVWVSRKCHFVVYGVSKFPFCCIWGLENAILLYVVSKMPFYCMWVIFVWGGGTNSFYRSNFEKKSIGGSNFMYGGQILAIYMVGGFNFGNFWTTFGHFDQILGIFYEWVKILTIFSRGGGRNFGLFCMRGTKRKKCCIWGSQKCHR